MNTVIYINGVKHHCTGVTAVFFADSPSHPHVQCSQHRIGTQAATALIEGMTVRTLGNTYSLRPPMATPRTPDVAPIKRSLPREPLADIVSDIELRHRKHFRTVAIRLGITLALWALVVYGASLV